MALKTLAASTLEDEADLNFTADNPERCLPQAIQYVDEDEMNVIKQTPKVFLGDNSPFYESALGVGLDQLPRGSSEAVVRITQKALERMAEDSVLDGSAGRCIVEEIKRLRSEAAASGNSFFTHWKLY